MNPFRPAPYLLMMLTLAACSHQPSRPKPEEIQSDLQGFGSRASYQPPELSPGQKHTEQWLNGSRKLDVLFEAPDMPGKYPLVVYLPGLGQDANSAPLWRDAWVRAGFAVLVIQHNTDATALTNLSVADRHDLKSIGHQHFSTLALEGRISDVVFALRTLEERIRAGKAPFTQARTDQFALAGFDLGAQTLQAILGESVKGIKLPTELPAPSAAILFGPHVDVARGGMQHRFEAITAPLLVVTGTDDHDPWGISSPSVRSAPWQQAKPGQKYLLTLVNGTHRQLAGIDPLSERPEDLEEDPDEIRHSEEEGMLSGPRGRGRPNVRGTPFGDARRGFGPGYDPKHYGQQLAAVQKISTAFLNAVLKKDRGAEDWIRNETTGWLKAAGQVRIR